MFHSGPEPGCLNRYGETCLPYVKATDFSDFGKVYSSMLGRLKEEPWKTS
jgi:hypothetical protein